MVLNYRIAGHVAGEEQAEPFWSDYEIDAHLFDDFLDDWLIKRIVSELRV